MRYNATIDLCKYVMIAMVVAIHTRLTIQVGQCNLLFPWLRVAVPMFFIISGYFLFSKVDQSDKPRMALRHFVSRMSILYLFWFCVLLPVTLRMYSSEWFSGNVLDGGLNFLKHLFFGSTFRASWFISASIIAAVIIFWIGKILATPLILVAVSFVYFAVCLDSSYMPFLAKSDFCLAVHKGWRSVFGVPYNSFPVAVFWMSIGKWFAEGGPRVGAVKNCFPWWMAFVVSCCALWVEWFWLGKSTGAWRNDCYFALAPVCILLFSAIKDMSHWSCDLSWLRRSSTVIYVLHGAIVPTVGSLIPVKDKAHILCFACVMAICMMVWWGMEGCSRHRFLRFLKYGW